MIFSLNVIVYTMFVFDGKHLILLYIDKCVQGRL